MTIKISRHAHGLLVAEPENQHMLNIALLRNIGNVTAVQLSRNKFLMPYETAHLLLNAFPPGKAEWEASALNDAERQKQHHEAQLEAHLQIDVVLEDPVSFLPGYDMLERLDAHQIAAVAVMSLPSLRGMAIFDEQGTGKTVMGLCGFDRLRQTNLIAKLLVIAPKSVLGGWEKDAKMLFGDRYRFVIVAGDKSQRRRAITGLHDILAISYETAASELALLRSIISINGAYMLIADESYYVKNKDARRSKAVSDIRKNCARAVVLCGTPAPNSPLDVVHQINIADNGVAFQDNHIPENDDEAVFSAVAIGLENAIYLRRLKQDVLVDIPSKVIERLEFPLQPIQRRLYDDARRDLVVAVRAIDDKQFQKQLTSFMARQVALLQICSHPGALDTDYRETPGKHIALDELLRQLIDQDGEKVVLWSYFRHSIESLYQRYRHYGVARIDGTVTEVRDRVEAINKFQNDPATRIFLGNAAAAGAGITLTSARHAIYESFSNQAAHYMQSVDRIHRRGQNREVTIHVLLTEDTIEETLFDRLIAKEQTGRQLLGDQYEAPLTRRRFLELLGENEHREQS